MAEKVEGATIVDEEVEERSNDIIEGVKITEHGLDVLKDDRKFFTTRPGKVLRNLQELGEWVKRARYKTFLEHFMIRKDIIPWIETLGEKELADKLHKYDKTFEELNRRREDWFKAVERTTWDKETWDEWLGGVQKEVAKVKKAIFTAILDRAEAIEKQRQDKIKGDEKKLKKTKSKYEDLMIKADELLIEHKEIYKIEDDVVSMIEDSNNLINWISETIPALGAETDEKKRVEGWEKVLEMMNTVIAHSDKISELVKQGKEKVDSLERGSKKVRKDLEGLERTSS